MLGLPLIDIRVSNPGAMPPSSGDPPSRQTARGWIAIGDRADGILLAIGGVARGRVAMGGMAIGGVSIGGLSMCVLPIGGLAVGAVAFGGEAIGWQACGGGAITWEVAVGGGAIAYRAAYGGGALAHDLAFGGEVAALHTNDEVAKNFFEGYWLVESLTWFGAHQSSLTAAIVVLSLLPALLMTKLMCRRKPIAPTS